MWYWLGNIKAEPQKTGHFPPKIVVLRILQEAGKNVFFPAEFITWIGHLKFIQNFIIKIIAFVWTNRCLPLTFNYLILPRFLLTSDRGIMFSSFALDRKLPLGHVGRIHLIFEKQFSWFKINLCQKNICLSLLLQEKMSFLCNTTLLCCNHFLNFYYRYFLRILQLILLVTAINSSWNRLITE